MKVSKVSALWDYIHRAMPWTTPKSLSPDEVYAVLAWQHRAADAAVRAGRRYRHRANAREPGRKPGAMKPAVRAIAQSTVPGAM